MSRFASFIGLWLGLLALLVGAAGPRPAVAQTGVTITIDNPRPGALVGSPLVVVGRVEPFPPQGRLVYRIMGVSGVMLGLGDVEVFGERGRPGSINATLPFTPLAVGGPIRLELSTLTAGGQTARQVWMDLRVAQSAHEQSIYIETPTPGSQVSSPVTITGRATRFPAQGQLEYTILGEGDINLGSGWVAVTETETSPAQFSASLDFSPPPRGRIIRVIVLERDPETRTTRAFSAVDVTLDRPLPPQVILIDSPAAGSLVFDRVVVAGRTARMPSRGFLIARVLDAGNAELATGVAPVIPTTDGSGTFRATLFFTPPVLGGPIRLELLDQTGSGEIVAEASLALLTPTPGLDETEIIIDTPPPNTVVGSPVVITGRTTRYPRQGVLFYRFFDEAGRQLDAGAFGVSPTPVGAAFNVSLTFNLPPTGRSVFVSLYEQDTVGNVLARTGRNLLLR